MSVNRTPPGNSSITQHKLNQYQYHGTPLKRSRTDDTTDNTTSMMQILMSIKEDTSRHTEQLQTVESKIERQQATIEEMKTNLECKIKDVDVKFTQLDAKVDNELSSLRSEINELQQEKLSAHMDITGLNSADVQMCDQDAKAGTINIMNRFGINVQLSNLRSAYMRTTRGHHKHILTAIFESAEEKVAVLKRKREWQGKTDIFFNHSMTPATRQLLGASKKKAKDFGSYAFLRRGKVFIKGGNNEMLRISKFSDLDQVNQQRNSDQDFFQQTAPHGSASNLMDQ